MDYITLKDLKNFLFYFGSHVKYNSRHKRESLWFYFSSFTSPDFIYNLQHPGTNHIECSQELGDIIVQLLNLIKEDHFIAHKTPPPKLRSLRGFPQYDQILKLYLYYYKIYKMRGIAVNQRQIEAWRKPHSLLDRARKKALAGKIYLTRLQGRYTTHKGQRPIELSGD